MISSIFSECPFIAMCAGGDERRAQHRPASAIPEIAPFVEITGRASDRERRAVSTTLTSGNRRISVRHVEEFGTCPVRVGFPSCQHFACEGAENSPKKNHHVSQARSRPCGTKSFHIESRGCKQTGGVADGFTACCFRQDNRETAPSRQCSRRMFQTSATAQALKTGRQDHSLQSTSNRTATS